MTTSMTIAAAAACLYVREVSQLAHRRVSMGAPTPGVHFRRLGAPFLLEAHLIQHQRAKTCARSANGAGLYSASQFELSPENVDMVLEDVRPYLIADGGNVDVVSVEDGVVSLKLQGACESCPSSTTTMTMGIEKVLKEKFGDSIREIRQLTDDAPVSDIITPEAVNSHLDVLRPAIKNYGGSVQVLSVEGGDCVVKYEGPESIGSGIKAAIKERFPAIVNVVFAHS